MEAPQPGPRSYADVTTDASTGVGEPTTAHSVGVDAMTHGAAGVAPDLNAPDLTALEAALFGAVRSGNCAEVTALLRQGARTDATDSDHCTPLHAAAQKGRAGVVPLLLRAGADVNAVAADDWTPLHLAAFLGRLAVVPQLLLAGANQVRVSSPPGILASTPRDSGLCVLTVSRCARSLQPGCGGRPRLHRPA